MRYIGGTNDDNREYLWTWMADRWPTDGGYPPMSPDFSAIYHGDIVDNKLTLLGVIGFTDWTPGSCSLHIATDGTGRWATRDFLYEMYSFLFDTRGLTSIYGIARFDNPAVVRVHRKVGHHEVCVLKHYDGKDRHAYLFTLTFEDWAVSKWNKKRVAFADPDVNTGQQDPKDDIHGQESSKGSGLHQRG